MDDLPANALRVYAAVFKFGGVRPAARRLRVSHSAVSRQLAVLEKWIGVRLFERALGQRRLQFSPQGESLAQAALASFEKLSKAVDSIKEPPCKHIVRLSTTSSVASLWLLPRLQRFRRAHPGLDLSVIVEQRIVNPASQESDLAIRMGRGPWPGLVCQPLMDDQLFPVMSPRYWEREGRPSRPNDLQHLELLHDRDPNTPWELWLADHCTVPVDTSKGPRYTSSDIVIRAAIQGLGVALARSRLAEEALTIGSLVRPFGDRSIDLPEAYWVVHPPDKDRYAVRTVIAWLSYEAKIPGTVRSGSDETGSGSNMKVPGY